VLTFLIVWPLENGNGQYTQNAHLRLLVGVDLNRRAACESAEIRQ
jgi:hypothetical protein